jgi:PilZ domain-containing protein
MSDSVQNSGILSRGERRAAQRFPLVLHLEYKAYRGAALVKTGGGRTINLSSAGVLFHADTHLEPGLRLELLIDWPAAPNGSTRMHLVQYGDVLRSDEDRIAVRVLRHDLRVETPEALSNSA